MYAVDYILKPTYTKTAMVTDEWRDGGNGAR
jgi:hypothetical protein